MTTATDKLKEGKKLLSDFENMRYMAELKALSNVSLERPLTDAEYERFKWLARKQGLGDVLIDEPEKAPPWYGSAYRSRRKREARMKE